MKDGLGKRALFLALFGAGISPTICFIITAVTTYLSSGQMHIIVPEFEAQIGNPLAALLIESAVCALYGAIGVGGAVVYEFEQWGVARVTAIHFSVLIISFFITGFYLKWMSPKDSAECVVMVVIWVVAYFLIWLINYVNGKAEIKKINRELTEWKKRSIAA